MPDDYDPLTLWNDAKEVLEPLRLLCAAIDALEQDESVNFYGEYSGYATIPYGLVGL